MSCRLLSRNYVRTSADFSREQVAGNSNWTKLGYQVTYLLGDWLAHESTSLDVKKTNGMLTSSAKRIFCDNVFALEQINAARIGVICQGASIAPHFLLARAQLSICFPISRSRIHPTASPYLCHADCMKRNSVRTSVDFSL